MPFRLHVPLPGPVSYSTRIGGGGGGSGGCGAVFALLFVLGLALAALQWFIAHPVALLVPIGVVVWVRLDRAAKRREALAAQAADGEKE